MLHDMNDICYSQHYLCKAQVTARGCNDARSRDWRSPPTLVAMPALQSHSQARNLQHQHKQTVALFVLSPLRQTPHTNTRISTDPANCAPQAPSRSTRPSPLFIVARRAGVDRCVPLLTLTSSSAQTTSSLQTLHCMCLYFNRLLPSTIRLDAHSSHTAPTTVLHFHERKERSVIRGRATRASGASLRLC